MQIIENDVLIFKSSNEDIDQNNDDPYVTILKQSNFTVHSIPVLEFYYVNLDGLQEKLLDPSKYSGIIFTSPRAVKATALSLDSKQLPDEWSNHPAYVVGEGTARVLLNELGLKGKGSSAGNASNLADLILETKYEYPLLFPCGNLKRDTLPAKLRNCGVDIDIVTVYQSRSHPSIEENLQVITSGGTKISELLVYFSPSGVQFTLPILRRMKVPLSSLKIVAIGPTTQSCLEDSQVNVWSSAIKPSPEHLLQAIVKQTQ